MPKQLPGTLGRDRGAIVQSPSSDDYIDANAIENLFVSILKRIEDLDYRLSELSSAVNSYDPDATEPQPSLNIIQITGQPDNSQSSTIIYKKDPYTLVPYKASQNENTVLIVTTNSNGNLEYTWDLEGVGILFSTNPVITINVEGVRQRVTLTVKETFPDNTSVTASVDIYLELSERVLPFANVTNLPQLYGKNANYTIYYRVVTDDNLAVRWETRGTYSATFTSSSNVQYTNVTLPKSLEPYKTYRFLVYAVLAEDQGGRTLRATEIYNDPAIAEYVIFNASQKLYTYIDLTPTGIEGSNIIPWQFVDETMNYGGGGGTGDNTPDVYIPNS